MTRPIKTNIASQPDSDIDSPRLKTRYRHVPPGAKQYIDGPAEFPNPAGLLSAILEGTTDPIYVKDRDGRYTVVNEACSRYIGILSADFVGKTDAEIFGAETARAIEAEDRHVIESGQTVTSEKRPTHAGLAGHVFLATKMPYREASGQIVGVIGIARDITSLKREEAKLSDTVSLLMSTLEATADGLVVVSKRGKIVTFNQKFVDMWEATPDLLAGQTMASLLDFILSKIKHPQRCIDHMNLLKMYPETTDEENIELKDGRIFQRFTQPQWLGGKPVGRVWSFRDVTEQVRVEERLIFKAFHDALTRLPNRALFFDRLDRALVHARRSRLPVAVLFLDLDNLKAVNDNLGHVSGDELLRELAMRVRSCVREGDTVARLSGDEFTVLLEEAGDIDSAQHVAGRIIEELRKPLILAGQSVCPIASIGLAIGNGEESADELLWRADAAMYHSKSHGAGECVLYKPGMSPRRTAHHDQLMKGASDQQQSG